MHLVSRSIDTTLLSKYVRQFPVTAILGPRQCGKTTLVKSQPFDHFFDLENPRDLAKLDTPQLALENLTGLIVIDEIQRKKELFPLLRFLVDNNPNQKYLILGSASRELIQQSSESLAGRVIFHELGGFRCEDIGLENIKTLWLRGGLPRSYLEETDAASMLWREQYIISFLERDIPQLGISIPAQTLRRFWLMICDYHGQVINYSEIARAFGISDMTTRKYLDILQSTFMIRILQPWFSNISKRQVKNPKIYIRDSGLFHSLLSIKSNEEIVNSVKLGASWEGFALEHTLRSIEKRNEEVFFWRTHAGTELDLLWMDKGSFFGAEFKYTDAPKMTKSIHNAINDLQLQHVWIVYPGKEKYKVDDRVTVLPVSFLDRENLS
ncbi:MAG: ATP-binding protein [Spirochaetales bacterium]|nr:ATP-binding protein [Spirochaetales bacterium]